MTCRVLENVLDSYLAGKLNASSAEAVENHIRSCEDCGRLLALARGELELPAGEAFTASVLQRTVGSACARARKLLGDRFDGALQPLDAELLGGHLDRCESCRALASALSLLQADLPGMGEIEPDPFFAPAVLRRLAAMQVSRRRLGDRIRQWWAGVVHRPRFSLEAAYIGTLVVILALGNPPSLSFGSFRTLGSNRSLPGLALQQVSVKVPGAFDACAVKGTAAVTSVKEAASEIGWSVQRSASSVWRKTASLKHLPDTVLNQAWEFWSGLLSKLRR